LTPLAIISLVVFVIANRTVERFELLTADGNPWWYSDDLIFLHVRQALLDATFYFAVICGYWSLWRPQQISESAQTKRRFALDAIGLIIAACWLTLVLVNATDLISLIHFAIRGVEVYQPTRWAGHDFYPANFQTRLNREFVTYGYVAALAISLAYLFAWLMIRMWRRGTRLRWIFGMSSLGCLAAAAWLVQWCGKTAVPTISPFLAATMGMQPAMNIMAGAVLIVAAITTAAMCLVREPASTPVTNAAGRPRGEPYLHERSSVLWFCLAGIACEFAGGVWRESLPLHVSSAGLNLVGEPELLIRFAVFIVLAGILWKRRRDVTIELPQRWAIDPAKFVAVWGIGLALIVLTIPVGAWYGVACLLRIGID
jgi:hypothetical protein